MPLLKQLLRDLRLVKDNRSRFGEDQEDKGKWYHLKNLKKNRRLQIAGGITAATLAGLGAYHANKRGVFDSKATRERKAGEQKHEADVKAFTEKVAARKEAEKLKKQKEGVDKAVTAWRAKKKGAESQQQNFDPKDKFYESRDDQKIRAERKSRKENRDQVNPEDIAADYEEEAGFKLFFGKYSSFGSTKKIDLNNIEQQIKPKDRSRIKRLLYNLLKRSGVKLGEYVDYTLKQLISMTVRFLGPIVLAAVLFRYRKRVYTTLVSKSDRDRLDANVECIGNMCRRPFR